MSYLARVAVIRSGLKQGRDVSLEHFNTHQYCLQQLLIGNVGTCAVGPAVLRLFEAQSRKGFRVILTSPEIPQTLFVVHRRVPIEHRETIRQTLVNSRLGGVNPELRKLFIQREPGEEGYFRTARDKNYDIIRSYLRLIDNQ